LSHFADNVKKLKKIVPFYNWNDYLCIMNIVNYTQLDIPFQLYYLPDDVPGTLVPNKEVNMGSAFGFLLCNSGNLKVISHGNVYNMQQGGVIIVHSSNIFIISEVSNDFKGIFFASSIEYMLHVINKVLDINTQMYLHENPYIQLSMEYYANLEHQLLELRDVIRKEDAEPMDTVLRVVKAEKLKAQIETIIYDAVCKFLQQSYLERKRPVQTGRMLQAFLISLRRNYRNHRDVAYYAAEQCVSSSYFSSQIKEQSGMTAMKWITDVVISNAKQSLEYTNVSIKSMAIDFGFPSQTFFSKYFKRYIGVSPKEYRKNKRK
jgi:AraC family transcriptional activator of pobA